MVIALFVVAACLYAARQVLLIRANRGEKIPLWWGQPQNSPRSSRVLTFLATMLVFLGAMNLDGQLALWSLLLLGVVLISGAFFLPPVLVQLGDRLRPRRGGNEPVKPER